ncbi:SNA2 integral membrane [Fusarium subglutinans]|uniref:SNA2 integral membrane n=1 Tax=Gibberella subglutinans TaxID=42677 RepID=A0A8H5V5W9_GIBSU|nr:SNA2 integral membrane [Fusarium subglutinans]KAF5610428.1 SNA2 integral membrane [Fusarium subglutinans]
MCSADFFLAFLAILFPPLPVWVKCGLCSADSLINILLCCLGYIPGLIHAWYIIAKYPEPPYEYESLPQDREGNRVTYVYVQCPPGPHQHGHPQNQQPKPQPQPHHGSASNNNNSMNYGTQNAGGSSRPAPQQHGVTNNGEGSSESQGVPPSYADVVAGDHKIQSKD